MKLTDKAIELVIVITRCDDGDGTTGYAWMIRDENGVDIVFGEDVYANRIDAMRDAVAAWEHAQSKWSRFSPA